MARKTKRFTKTKSEDFIGKEFLFRTQAMKPFWSRITIEDIKDGVARIAYIEGVHTCRSVEFVDVEHLADSGNELIPYQVDNKKVRQTMAEKSRKINEIIDLTNHDVAAVVSHWYQSRGLPQQDSDLLLGVLNSSLFYLWFIAFSDTRHLNVREIKRFPVALMTTEQHGRLKDATSRLMLDYEKHKERKTTYYEATGTVEYDEYHPGASKDFIDEVDRVLAEIYGLTDLELEYVKDFNYKFRMGQYLRRSAQ